MQLAPYSVSTTLAGSPVQLIWHADSKLCEYLRNDGFEGGQDYLQQLLFTRFSNAFPDSKVSKQLILQETPGGERLTYGIDINNSEYSDLQRMRQVVDQLNREIPTPQRLRRLVSEKESLEASNREVAMNRYLTPRLSPLQTRLEDFIRHELGVELTENTSVRLGQILLEGFKSIAPGNSR